MEAFFPSVPKYDVDELPVDVYSAPHPQSVRTRSGSSLKDILALTFLWLVSAALQAGVDCQEIRLIVHLLSTFTIIDYLQELGRGGRDGKPFASILLYSSVQIGQMKKDDTLRKGPPNPLIKYLTLQTCRRQYLFDCFDTRGQLPSKGHLCCDNCRSDCDCGCKNDPNFVFEWPDWSVPNVQPRTLADQLDILNVFMPT